jgi:ATP-binding cassette, subfamily B, bacterial MsbA
MARLRRIDMNKFLLPASADKYYGIATMVRRLVAEQGLRHWKKYLVAFILMAVVAACTALVPYFFGQIINQAQVSRNMPGVLFGAGMVFLLFCGKGLASYGQSVILARIANRIIISNQRKVFIKLLNENLGFYADRHSTEFITRVNTGADATAQVLNLLITSFGRDLFSLIGLAIVMVVQDPVMSLTALLVAPPALLLLRKLIQRIRAIARARFHGGVQALETLQETLQGIRIVKAFTLEDTMRERFDRQVSSVEQAANKMARVANRANPLMEILGGFALTLATIYGGYRTIVQGAAPGEFFSFIAAFLLAYEPARRLARLNLDLNSGMVGVRLLFEILDSPETEPRDDHKPPLRASIERIEFSNVSFSYRTDEPTLHDMSFVAEPGTMTALVGPSGGGKSTVFNLLLRFYEAPRGEITIGGQDITAVSRASLRRHIGYVGQDVFLFRGTIRDNIAYGKPGASQDDIVAAAKGAHAHDFIQTFPNGYDTEVGEHGLQLSGGQRQRIAIARALIKDAPVVLLDEATAALDSESELLVREAIAHLCTGKTTLVIAHRLHTIAHADRIHVIEAGRVVESGRHDELLRKGGRYAQFYRLQLQEQERSEPLAANL